MRYFRFGAFAMKHQRPYTNPEVEFHSTLLSS